MSSTDKSFHGPGARRRIIEAQMPLTAISVQSAREKSIRHGHLSTLHIWWARRPLAACRAAIFAALVPQPDDPKQVEKLQTFIAELSNWDNSNDNASAIGGKEAHHYIREARKYILDAFGGRAPRVLDPFAGGGAIPLEALRLGCETHALDLNPVAHIIQLATLVYPQQYAYRSGPYGSQPGATLSGDVQKWGKWVLDKAREEIGDLYPKDPDGATTVAYLWARTIPCPNAACGVPVPLIRQTWLVRKAKKNVAYKVEADGPGDIPRFRIVQAESSTDFDFNPSVGTSLGGIASCPSCGSPLSDKLIKSEAIAGRLGALPIAVITDTPGKSGKRYRDVMPGDLDSFLHAEKRLADLQESYDPLRGELSPIPDERLVDNDTMNIKTPLYGLATFDKLFNARQGLSLATFARLIREAYQAIVEVTNDAEYAKAITTYLGITLDRQADRCSVLCRWDNGYEKIANVFGRQALPMVWDYAEVNPFSGLTGDWDGAIDWVRKVIEHAATTADIPADVRRGSAIQLPYPDNYFDAVITDPPYYNNIAYSELSDYFYVWLKRTVGTLHPIILGTPVTPKDQEVIEGGALKRSKEWFEHELARSFGECSRVLRDDGICVVVYAHKAVSAWESLVASLLKAGLTVDGSWPFNTELGNRLLGQGTAALASSIFLVCRKRKVDAGVGIAGDVRRAIEVNVRQRLDQFWDAGLRGADFFISAIGPATEAFSRYDKVMTMGGADVTVSTLLEWVQQTVADYALRRVFTTAAEQGSVETGEGLGEIDDETRFYVLWRWTYDGQGSMVGVTNGTVEVAKETVKVTPSISDVAEDDSADGGKGKEKTKKIPFGDALLMAFATGADAGALINKHHILDGSSAVTLLGAKDRSDKIADFGERRADGSRPPLIDILHRAELLWATGQQDALEEYLDDVLPGDREALRRVAQALVELLPRGDLEKQRLEGFLYSGVAQDNGDGLSSRRPSAVQTGFGYEFGVSETVVRGKTRKR